MPQFESMELDALVNKAISLVRQRLFIANANGELEECLAGLGLSELIADEGSCRQDECKYGRIIVIGDSMVDERLMSFGKSHARVNVGSKNRVTFADVLKVWAYRKIG